MSRSVRRVFRSLVLSVFVLPSVPQPALSAPTGDDGPGVSLRLVQDADLSLDEATLRLEGALRDAGWNVVTRLDCGVDADACAFRTRVIVAHQEELTSRLMGYGTHAAFAVPIRFAVYEDENGVHIGATNPMNLFPTIVDESTEPSHWADVAMQIREVTAGAFPEWLSEGQYGQRREKARIGRTFGIMAGGPFVEKIERIALVEAEGTAASLIADLVVEQMPMIEGDWDWGIQPIYVIDLPEQGVSILGLTAGRMEADAFQIVGSGGDDARKSLACPGIDHAPAFPVEVLVAEVEGGVEVSLVDEMYRMKMFFEDAGKMAFAKNMGMPGSIEDEIKKKIGAILW
jgi:uncharacterized protein (DUF302 family)